MGVPLDPEDLAAGILCNNGIILFTDKAYTLHNRVQCACWPDFDKRDCPRVMNECELVAQIGSFHRVVARYEKEVRKDC